VVLDADLCVVYANVAAQDLLAVSVNQARGKPFLALVLEADSLQPLMRRALETGETLSEREMAVMTGPLGRESRVIDFTMTPLDSEFERKYLLLEIADATQRQRITRENELMARLDSSRQMVRQLAHEIKNPLGGLRGAAQLLERELHEHLREYTGVIISEADRLTALVDSMIGPARAPQKALINIHEICEHVYRPACAARRAPACSWNATTTLPCPMRRWMPTRSSRHCSTSRATRCWPSGSAAAS
jgi:two-component system nitrogen regulation sensor histidine kinase GlnL